MRALLIASGALVLACSSSGKGPAGANNREAPPGSGNPPAPVNIAQAEGDPCRGTPLPTTSHFVAAGLCARVVGSAPQVRQLAFAPNGDLLAGSLGGTIYLFRDDDKDGVWSAEETHAWADTQGNANNPYLDVASGYVYAGSPDGVVRFKYDATSVKGGPREKVVVHQPNGGHAQRTVQIYDGFLYVHSGSSGNVPAEASKSEYDTNRSLVKRFEMTKLDPAHPFEWSAGEPFTLGLRNNNGLKRNEKTKRIYGVVNGLDDVRYNGIDVHQDNPGEYMVEIASGNKYGYPFCFAAQRINDNGTLKGDGVQLKNEIFGGSTRDQAWCDANAMKPVTFFQAHSAPLDLVFFDNQPTGALPEKWRGGAFVALHGSWDRDASTGRKVVWQPMNDDGTAVTPTSTLAETTFKYETVFGGGDTGGAKDGFWEWRMGDDGDSPRPAGVTIGPIDGALYIASDEGGYVYRVGVQKQP